MKHLAILGASGHGKVVADCAESCGWQEVSFFDDAWPARQRNGLWPVVGDSGRLLERLHEFDGVLVAIGNNAVRQTRLHMLADRGATLPVLIHPSAVVSRRASLGPGSVVFANAVINADCEIGPGAIVNTAATVDHDCRLGSAVHVSPGAHLAGGVQAGDRSWLGIGCAVVQLIRIGRDVTVGAGAVVVADIPDESTAIGVPARYR